MQDLVNSGLVTLSEVSEVKKQSMEGTINFEVPRMIKRLNNKAT
jgi:hypothetical protein